MNFILGGGGGGIFFMIERQRGGFVSSDCGAEFDEYVERTLQYDDASAVITNLWPNRRLKLFTSPTTYRTARVKCWTQHCSNNHSSPFYCRRRAKWDLQVEFDSDSIKIGDTVELMGRRSATHLNGRKGVVRSHLEKGGRYMVELLPATEEQGSSSSTTVIGVKPENLKLPPTRELSVVRMNIQGGGTLRDGHHDDDELLSLEWLDPPSPVISLQDSGPNCPSCRATEPPVVAFNDDDDVATMEQQCPICLETTNCRLLKCGHAVCQDCWSNWRLESCSMQGYAQPDQIMDAHELTRERDRRKQDYQRVYPHTMGGTCTSSQDAPEVVDKAQMTGRSRLIDDLQELCELVSEDGIDELRRELMVMDFFPLRMPWTVRYLLDNLPIEGVEIYLQCVEARLEELRSHLEAEGEDSSDQALADVFNRQYGLSFCNKIGERYEDDGSYRKAIAWYARSLVYAKKLSPESLKKHGKLPSLSYCNLGLAQKKAGLLTEALSSYDECLRLLGDPNDLDEDGTDMLDAVSENRDSLFEEIAKWTGKSGKLTPGC